MAESSCCTASLSPPPNVFQEAYEGNPRRALTESISFGRYASEPLAWEKWSAFTSNRCLEEVAQLSKAVSVSERKAYFEAHFQRRAIMKAAAVDERQANSMLVDSDQTLNIPDVISDDGMFNQSVMEEECFKVPESRTNIEDHPSIHTSDHKESDIQGDTTLPNDYETTEDDESCIFYKVIVTNVVAPKEEDICENLGSECVDETFKDSTCKEFNDKENLVLSEQRRHDLNEVLVTSCGKAKIRKEWDRNHTSRVYMNKSLTLPQISSNNSFSPSQKRRTTSKNISNISSIGPVDSRVYMTKSQNFPKVSSSKSFSPSPKCETTPYPQKTKKISTFSSIGPVNSRVCMSKSQNFPKVFSSKAFSPLPKGETAASYVNETPNRFRNLPCNSMHTSMRFYSLSNKPPSSFQTNSIQLPTKSKPSVHPSKKSSPPPVSTKISKAIPSTISTPFRFRSEERAAARKERLGKKLMGDDKSSKREKSSANHKIRNIYSSSKTIGKIQSSGKLQFS